MRAIRRWSAFEACLAFGRVGVSSIVIWQRLGDSCAEVPIIFVPECR